ncbi:MAG: hypothetical protein ABIH67_02470 [Candidatus Uhrbacteria bacterium]
MTIKSSIRLPDGIDENAARQLRKHSHLQVSLDGEHLAALHPDPGRRGVRFYHSTNRGWNVLPIKDARLLHVGANRVLITGHDSNPAYGPRRNYLVDNQGRIIGSVVINQPGKNRLRQQWYTSTGASQFSLNCLGLPTEIYRDETDEWWLENEFLRHRIPGKVNLAQNSPDKQAYILLVEPPQSFDETRLPFRRLLLMRTTDPPTTISDQPFVEMFYSGHFHLITPIWVKPYGHLVLLVDKEEEDEYSFDYIYSRKLILPGNGQSVSVPDGHRIKEVLLTENGSLIAFISRATKTNEHYLHDRKGNKIINAPEIWNLSHNPEGQGFRYNLIDGDSIRLISLGTS